MDASQRNGSTSQFFESFDQSILSNSFQEDLDLDDLEDTLWAFTVSARQQDLFIQSLTAEVEVLEQQQQATLLQMQEMEIEIDVISQDILELNSAVERLVSRPPKATPECCYAKPKPFMLSEIPKPFVGQELPRPNTKPIIEAFPKPKPSVVHGMPKPKFSCPIDVAQNNEKSRGQRQNQLESSLPKPVQEKPFKSIFDCPTPTKPTQIQKPKLKKKSSKFNPKITSTPCVI